MAVGLIAVGWLLILVGNLVLGGRREGGKRLVVFMVGCGMSALAIWMCRHFWPAFTQQDYPAALAFCLGVAFLAVGVAGWWTAAFATNEKVRSWFDAVLRGV